MSNRVTSTEAFRRIAAPLGAVVGMIAIAIGAFVSPVVIERWATDSEPGSLAWGPALCKALLVWHGAVALLLAWHLTRQTTTSGPPRRGAQKRVAWSMAVLLLCGAALALRMWHLETDLWLDEVLTVVDFLRLPLPAILATFPSQNQHPLYSVLGHVSIRLFGESASAARLPAVLFGVASIWAVWRLGCRVTTRREALLAALLMTVSYHHVWFSQNARGYTGLLLFSILTTDLWLEASDRRRLTPWLAYAVSAALGLWTHMTLAFVLLAHGVVFLLGLPAAWRTRDRAVVTPVAAWVLGATLTLQLHALALPEFLSSALHEVSAPSEWTDPRWVLYESLRRLGDGGLTLLPVLAALLVAGAGLGSLTRRDWRVSVLFVVPPLVGGATMLALGHNLWPRFFFFAVGFVLLAVVRGMFAISEVVTRVKSPLRDRLGLSGPALGTAACIVAALVSLITVPRSYLPKQDYSGARDFVSAQLQRDEAVVTAGLAGLAYGRYYAPDWPVITTAAELDALTADRQGVWMVYTLPTQLQAWHPDVWRRVQGECRPVRSFPGTLGGGAITVCRIAGGRALTQRSIAGPIATR